MASVTYLNNVDTEKVEQLLNETEANVEYFNETSIKVARKFSEPLDNLMNTIRQIMADANSKEVFADLSDKELEHYYLELSNALYYMGERLERLGIHADMSEAAAKEVYNNAYLNKSMDKDEKGKSKSTVAELTATAESESQYEQVVSSIYEHAYKILKFKVDKATELVSTLKNIMKKRQQDSYLASVATNGSTNGEVFSGD